MLCAWNSAGESAEGWVPMRVKSYPAAFVATGMVLAILLAGCGAATKARIGGRQSGSSATTTATATLGPSPIPTAPLDQQASCEHNSAYTLGTFKQVGGLIVSPVGLGLDNPSEQVPDGTPSKPIQIPTNGTNNPFPNSPAVNPQMHEGVAGITFNVCNALATGSHTLQSVSVTIASFTPYTGQLNAWQPCDGAFTKHYGYSPAGCPGDNYFDELLHATFGPSDGVGASVIAAQTGVGLDQNTGRNASPLPLALATGASVSVDVGITVPTAPGTYTFAFSLVVDGAAPVTFATTDPLLFAPVARWWSGKGCGQPAMLSQIPASAGQDDEFICPEA